MVLVQTKGIQFRNYRINTGLNPGFVSGPKVSTEKFACEIQTSELVRGGRFLIHNIFLFKTTPHETVLLSLCGLKGKNNLFHISHWKRTLSLSLFLSLLINSYKIG